MSSYQGDAHGNSTFFETEEHVETKIVSVYTPLIYSAILILSLVIFGSQYRKRRIAKMAELPSIFDDNDARDIHVALKELNDEQPVHEKVLKAALLNRGAEAIRRSFKMKELEPQINILYKNGSIGEDYWQRYQNEVKLIELEFKQTLQEAQEIQPGWLQMFVVVAKEICFNQALARRYNSILKRKTVCAEEWELKLDNNGRLIE
ncbi:hypothetical protein ZYGR_0U02800 [Zygosaccharomyces rouxii]|uniref:ZYRO0F15026p n=2 Tax=Zygosaccharomyces rouxii TaxID=4956 RepID=C5DYR0_ZYGRC|nr:uncharacterized protein ZYRO0F15026g [Zygosaccharomyces rouxii]KAH9199677.1 Sec62/63 complex, subunit Sec66 [Zygosaccharomyces rouxii]GAV50424.1 hypothetical protein ZYGR_0U02800 [Zygosaccharomyces rouxii]CAR28921.1 ZYRO0F15026p [Zygosaccharomyces rouxii]